MSTANQDNKNSEDLLRRLNHEVGDNEKAANRSFFVLYLADDLVFRRANGDIVEKEAFLDGLMPDQFDMLETSVDALDVKGNSAVVDVTVKAQRRGQKAGEFRNIRVFQRAGQQAHWQLRAWINTKIRDL
jgi:hypothetical protein